MDIREYRKSDEQAWLHCRVVAFLDCSYYRDVKTQKEQYEHPSISYVAQQDGILIGLIDVELDSDALSYKDKGRGAIIWHMAVLPEYRHLGVARKLWEITNAKLLEQKVDYCELWTQEDIAANSFYKSIGFICDTTQTWLRCYMEGRTASAHLDKEFINHIYGVEEVVFDAPINRKDELRSVCSHMDEVRLYTRML